MKKKTKVAFQGEKGAYSHLACLEIFPDIEAVPCSTFEEAFQLVKDNSEYKIVIPIENSLAGRVADIHYLIPKYKLQIHAEHFQKVTHNLLGVKGSSMKDIKIVRSHSQAIGQCSKIIFNNKLQAIISADTAGSAKFIANKNDKSESAIASKLAAEIYNLEILKSNFPKLKIIARGSKIKAYGEKVILEDFDHKLELLINLTFSDLEINSYNSILKELKFFSETMHTIPIPQLNVFKDSS